jgi:hypothetical protein
LSVDYHRKKAIALAAAEEEEEEEEGSEETSQKDSDVDIHQEEEEEEDMEECRVVVKADTGRSLLTRRRVTYQYRRSVTEHHNGCARRGRGAL